MTTKRVTPFTVGRGSVQPWEGSALVQVNAPFVPTLLHRLEVYKSRFTYESDADWGAGLDLVNRQQMELLMDIGDRLISEVRALRHGTLTPETDRNPQIDPYTVQLPTLGSIVVEEARTGDNVEACRLLLVEIRDNLAQEQNLENIEGLLSQIALLLA